MGYFPVLSFTLGCSAVCAHLDRTLLLVDLVSGGSGGVESVAFLWGVLKGDPETWQGRWNALVVRS